jgi:hypothetical protein
MRNLYENKSGTRFKLLRKNKTWGTLEFARRETAVSGS